jgi:hypothetical protein
MKTAFRRDLAQLSFEEKIRKVDQLIRTSQNAKASGVAEHQHNRSCSLGERSVAIVSVSEWALF